jgi:hypothetical protein
VFSFQFSSTILLGIIKHKDVVKDVHPLIWSKGFATIIVEPQARRGVGLQLFIHLLVGAKS